MPKFIVTERYYRRYEIEADSFEEAEAIADEEAHDGEEVSDGIAYITAEDGTEQIYS
jgi:hypothetical protein